MLLESPVRASVAAFCPVATWVVGGLLVPKNTSYVSASPSGSEQLQLNVGDVETPIAASVGLGFEEATGGLVVVKLQTVPLVVAPLLSLAFTFQ